MGNSNTKEARPPGSSRHNPSGHSHSPTASGAPASSSQVSSSGGVYTHTSSGGRRSRHDLFLGLRGNADVDPSAPEARRETKAEREARKLEKERAARLKERERSMREEGVDGGYLVTVGVYTGPEDFSKPIVRQLMIERRIAPFWRGLNNHEDSWTEHQLVAAAKGLPIPAADEIPEEDGSRRTSVHDTSPRQSDTNINSLTIPITGRSPSHSSETNLAPSHPAFSLPSPPSPFGSPPASTNSPFFRGRAKTLAVLTTSRNSSQSEMVQQEIQLPKEPYVNGQRVEAFLYKDAAECPICFLYYPPWLNKTRCCDQPICSECFVQIKRPDPHPPEHHDDDPSNTTQQAESSAAAAANEDYQLVSEPSTCPFCKMPEFGVTFDPPPFRRGLAYANPGAPGNPLASAASAMSSSSSLNSQGLTSPGGSSSQNRRRTTSLSASAPQVITTDRVRPDWAKKLSDARAQALRRAAAATALHNAAYVLGNVGGSDGRGTFGRRSRRPLFGGNGQGLGDQSPGSGTGGSGSGTPRHGDGKSSRCHTASILTVPNVPMAQSNTPGGASDLPPPRNTSRRARIEDIEELMMMEAIRLSLQAEEERKKKEEKEREKDAKKEEKRRKKEEKKSRKSSGGSSSSVNLYATPVHNASTASDLASAPSAPSASGTTIPSATLPGKGKAPVGGDPSRSISVESATSSSAHDLAALSSGPQAHLEQSRATLAAHNHLGDVHIPQPSLLASHQGMLEGAEADARGEEVGDEAEGRVEGEGRGEDGAVGEGNGEEVKTSMV
ncbi:hypothetical protein P152DRAFT_447060 [Eremomyces bilateralis CBS 781.70]|uniref:Protein sip5 n=1 Tax=Eremomyces bilateralis CBS 781.70 TaxID=1392243 RepID=A0A6G1G9T1_9PEZI|nr:uncharacterized protein P152DRAFT_447060 [Eremomyces bilateralis CBS 781.70]KAF1814752.1 hypothetical protein P152DRAFT_447060 [Eremomyces bilateralis CBS 781.70]